MGPVQFRQLLKLLNDNGVEFVVIGGVAASLNGVVYSTMDLDVCAPLRVENVKKILNAVRAHDPRWRMRPDKPRIPDDPEYFAGFKNLFFETDIGILDVLGDLPNIGSYESLADKTIDIPLGDFSIRVLDLETLIEVKKAAGRNKDKLLLPLLEEARQSLFYKRRPDHPST